MSCRAKQCDRICDRTVESKHPDLDSCFLGENASIAQHDMAGPLVTRLPDPARVRSHHLLSGFAAEGLLEFRHVREHIVDAEYGQRVRIRSNDQTRNLRADIRAPRIRI